MLTRLVIVGMSIFLGFHAGRRIERSMDEKTMNLYQDRINAGLKRNLESLEELRQCLSELVDVREKYKLRQRIEEWDKNDNK